MNFKKSQILRDILLVHTKIALVIITSQKTPQISAINTQKVHTKQQISSWLTTSASKFSNDPRLFSYL